MAVKIPALLHKMSQSAQKAWYKKNNMEMPSTSVQTGGKSAAAAKRVKVAPRKASDVKPDSVRAINAARQAAYMAKGGRAPIGAAGSGGSSVMAGSNMSTAKGIVAGIKAGFNPKVSLSPYEGMTAKEKKAMKKEEVEQVDEAGKGYSPGWMLKHPDGKKLALELKRKKELERKRQKSYGDPSAGISVKKEEAEQVDEGSKRMSAAVKLQRAFDREKAASDASRKRGEEVLAQARAEYAKKQAAKTNEEVEQVDEGAKEDAAELLGGPVKEKPKMPPGKQPAGYRYVRGLARKAMKDSMKKEEVEQVDEVNYKKYLKVSQEKRPLTPSAVAVAMSAEKEGNPNPARKLRNTQDARKFANKQLTKQVAKTRPAQKFPVYEPGRKYVGDSVELDGPVIDEANSRNSATAMQQALTPKASDVKAAVGTTARDKATTNKYARRISKLTGNDYSKQDVKDNLKSLKTEDTEMDYIEEKLTAADPASKWISDFVKSDNPKFAGKSKKERIQQALGAYYAAKGGKNEEVVRVDEVSSKKSEKFDITKHSYEPQIHPKGEHEDYATHPAHNKPDAVVKVADGATAHIFHNYDFKKGVGHGNHTYVRKNDGDDDYVYHNHSKVPAAKVKHDFTNLDEEVEQVDEVSQKVVRAYRDKARDDYEDAKGSRFMSKVHGDDTSDDDKKIRKRAAGIELASAKIYGRSKVRMGEEAEQVDEFVDRETRLAARKAETGSSTRVSSGDVLGRRGGHETPKQAIARRVGKDFYGIKSGGKTSIYNRSPKPNLPEEAEQVDEVSQKMVRAYRDKARDDLEDAKDNRAYFKAHNDNTSYEDDKIRKRTAGIKLATRKIGGVAKVRMREEVGGKTPETDTEVSLAKMHGNPKKITYGDVVKARIASAKKKALNKG